MRVLIVDDDREKVRALAAELVAAGVPGERIEHAADARDARKRLRATCYDLVLIDVALPNTIDGDIDRRGGIDLMRDLYQQSAYYPPVCTIGVTGFEELVPSARDEFAALGVSFVYYGADKRGWAEAVQNAARTCLRRRKAPPPVEFGVDLAVVCALYDPELRAILENGWKWSELEESGDHWRYWTTEVHAGERPFSVRACFCPRMGTEAATIASMKMIERFRPRYLVMTGIAAGIVGKANPGDVVAADPAWNWGCGKWVRVKGEPQFQPSPHHLALEATIRTKLEAMSTDAELLAGIRDRWRGEKPDASLRLLLGPMASGASVLADPTIPKMVKEQHRKLTAIEMEAYGVFAAAAEARSPRPVPFALKSVVDFGDAKKSDKFQPYGAYTSAAMLTAFVERVLATAG